MITNTDSNKVQDLRETSEDREVDCPFCEIPQKRILEEDELCYVIRDGFPVTDLHTLVIPKRHVETYFDLYQPELNSCNRMIQKFKDRIEKEDESVKGFNIGINNGEVAGQTVFHCHIHLIPRREGDVENPKGGVRGVIPKKQQYGIKVIKMNNKKVSLKDDNGRDCVIENIQTFHTHLEMFHKKGVSIHDENGHYFTVDDSFREKINGLVRERS